MTLSLIKGLFNIVYFHTHVHVHIDKMGNLSKSKIKLYICDNKLRSHDQNTPQVQIYNPGVYLHRGVYCAYERGFSLFNSL